MFIRFIISLGLVAAFFISEGAYAATITKVKGKKVLIDLEDTDAEAGDYFYVMKENGKRSGIVKIVKTRRGKAIGRLGKGKAVAGRLLERRPPRRGDKRSRKVPSRKRRASAPPGSPDSEAYWGLMLGTNSSEMSVELAPNDTVELSGSGFSAKALMDYAVFQKLWFRGLLGMESLTVSGDQSSNCSPTVECEVDITYLSLDLCGRYLFSLSSFRPWMGGCFDLFFPMSKDSTALEDSSITNTSVMAFALGFDWFVGKSFAIPISAEYGIYPSSEQVTANAISIRGGFAVAF